MKDAYIRLNDDPIELETVPYTINGFDGDPDDPDTDPFCIAFWFGGRYYNIDEFVRTHNNPWVGGDFPDYIHGVEYENYYHPLFIELIGDSAVNVYECREIED